MQRGVAKLSFLGGFSVFEMAQHQERKIGFKSVRLFKDQTLGIGSYGAVCIYSLNKPQFELFFNSLLWHESVGMSLGMRLY